MVVFSAVMTWTSVGPLAHEALCKWACPVIHPQVTRHCVVNVKLPCTDQTLQKCITMMYCILLFKNNID